MSHEPECDDFQNGNSDGDCICHLTRPAYQRGRKDATGVLLVLHAKDDEGKYCLECFKAYPCVTIRALGGKPSKLEHADDCDLSKGCTCGTRTIAYQQEEQ